MNILAMFIRLGSANVLMLGAHVVTIGILGAIAPPEQFAIFLLALSISQPFATFAGLRLESAFPSISGRRELGAMLVMATSSTVLVSLLQVILVAILRRYQLFELDQLDFASLAILPLMTFAQALVQIGRLWAVRMGHLRAVVTATHLRAATTLISRGAVIAVFYLAPAERVVSTMGTLLLAGELITTTIMAIGLFPLATFAVAGSKLKMAPAIAALRRNWKFPLLETPSTILDNLAMNAPIFLVTQYFGLTATANFGLAFRGLAVPIAQVSRTLTEVMQVRYSELQRGGSVDEFAGLFRRSTLLMSMAAIAGLALLGIGYLALDRWIVSERWREFANIIVIISPWVSASAVLNINSRLLLMLKRQELKLVYDTYSIVAVALLVALERLLSPKLDVFVGLISGAQFAGYVLYWLLIRQAISQYRMRARQPRC